MLLKELAELFGGLFSIIGATIMGWTIGWLIIHSGPALWLIIGVSLYISGQQLLVRGKP